MPESSIVVRPEPMDSGSYTAASRLQAAGLAPAVAVFGRAAAQVSLPTPPQPIVIADYGAASGHNSLLPVGAAISALRSRTAPDHSVLVVHTDRPDNDFTALFRTLEEDPDSYLTAHRATFASAVGRSYYSQILPSNSVHLGWTSWSVQWTSRLPVDPAAHAGQLRPACCDVESVCAAYARQAAHDWHEFIAFRGRELCTGGRLVVMTLAVGEDGERGFGPLVAALTDALTELTSAGVVSADEVNRMCLPIVGRTAADFRAPFAPSGLFERLQVEHLEVFDGEDRFWTRYEKDRDATAFGAPWAQFARASVFPAFTSALDDPARAGDVADRLESAVAARLSARPERTPIPLAHVVLVKRPRP
jgi:salicylate 1-O-methyltransferase